MRGGILSRLLTAAITSAILVPAASAAGLGAGVAYAASTTRYVGTSAGGDTSCANPGYTTVQAAVNAANPGDTIHLCGTTPFREQVIITKSVRLTGGHGAAIAAPSPWVPSADPLPPQFTSDNLFRPQAIVVVWGADVHVTISGLTIAGPLPGNGGCAEQEFGILVIGGAAARIRDDTVTDIKDANSALYGCQYGIGIQVGREYWPTSTFSTFLAEDFIGTGSVSGTKVTGYQKGGIVIDGPGSSGSVSDSTVTGAGPAGALGQIIAQNGIQISRGAAGRVSESKVSANQYSGPGFASDGGILLFGGCGDPLTRHISVSRNTLTNNDVGVYLANYDPTCTVAPGSATRNRVTHNRISSAAVTNTTGDSQTPPCGYQAGISDLGNRDLLDDNSISGAGYRNHPTCTPGAPYVTFRIDTTGSIGTRELHTRRAATGPAR
jgi:hypothetical protein